MDARTGRMRFRKIDLYGKPDIPSIIRRQAAEGLIDSIYLFPGKESWFEVADDPAYGYHEICLSTLDSALRSETWRNLSNSIGAFVDMGVGTGEKLTRFAAGTFRAEKDDTPVIIAIDVNQGMLTETTRRLEGAEALHTLGLEVISARSSFAQLPDVLRHEGIQEILPANRRIAYLLLGNTFCNLAEEPTLEMFQTVMRDGDLLTLSLEFGSIGPDANSMADILARYKNSKSISQLFWSPFKNLDGHISPLEITAVRSDRRFTCLDKTSTVIGRAFWNGKEVVTGRSSRHDYHELVALFEQHNFSLQKAFSLPESRFYNYLLFQKHH